MSTVRSDAPPFICPYCEKKLELPDDNTHYYNCTHCGHLLDLPGQYAFLRGVSAFDEAQDAYQDLKRGRGRRPTSFSAAEDHVVELFAEAYSALQLAFTSDLADHQRTLGVAMMVNMAVLFLRREMVSGLEASYWNTLMVEHTAQNEYDSIRQKLSGPLNVFSRVRWSLRKQQLKRAFPRLDQRIRVIESSIAFIDRPRARRSNWKPLD